MQHAGRKGLYQCTYVHLEVGRKAWYWGVYCAIMASAICEAQGGQRPGGWVHGLLGAAQGQGVGNLAQGQKGAQAPYWW